ncbi:hypothetical protein C5167_008537 [Papaver somniferum]|uniref:Uncharacterized protein n=1 Tax=Papaver somniferum TaxID=3469 RepID=A0A4Y7JVW6_PAPSO|nr:hypothetical protein C5167_008537 [Papaver somniferum]
MWWWLEIWGSLYGPWMSSPEFRMTFLEEGISLGALAAAMWASFEVEDSKLTKRFRRENHIPEFPTYLYNWKQCGLVGNEPHYQTVVKHVAQ